LKIQSIIQPKRPKAKAWWQRKDWQMPVPNGGYPVVAWQHPSGLFVLSALEVPVAEPGAEAMGPQWHISISLNGWRCDSNQAKWVLKQFGMEAAEEDNHVPGGFVRNFWLPVADKYAGYQCPCKDDEPAMVEDKGDFVWRGITR
jgi:hypothetical protein